MNGLLIDLVKITVGLALLLTSAGVFVRNAAKAADLIGTSRLFIGLTLIAVGTSAPELSVGVYAQLSGNAEIGLGNTIGSNIFNIFFVVGLAAVVRPIVIMRRNVQRDVPILLAVYSGFFILALNRTIDLPEALLLILALAGYLYYSSRSSSARTDPGANISDNPDQPKARPRPLVLISLIAVSLAVLILASHLLVTGATGIAGRLGMSQLVIGLTIVAVGTSLPEIATTVAAVRQEQYDLAVGNVLGSCFFNIAAIPAAMALISPSGLTVANEAVFVDIPIMILALVACIPIFLSGHRVSRAEGISFLVCYAAYGFILYSRSTPHSLLAQPGWALALIATLIMITAIPATATRVLRSRRVGRGGLAE